MAAARAREHHAPRPRIQPRRKPRAVPTPRQGASGIRWDRVSRVGLLLVLILILGLYIGPARSYFATRTQAAEKRQAVEKLQAENARLKARAADLRNPATLEREARRMGMVRPGERAYTVKGLPRGR